MAVAGDKDLDIPRGRCPPRRPAAAGPLPRQRRRLELAVLLAPALVLFVGFVLLPIVLAA